MMEITTLHYIVLGAIMFGIGLIGFITRRNMVVVLMCVELMINAVNINFIAFADKFNQMSGQVMALFIITVAACEAAVGLAIIILMYKAKQVINVDEISDLKY